MVAVDLPHLNGYPPDASCTVIRSLDRGATAPDSDNVTITQSLHRDPFVGSRCNR